MNSVLDYNIQRLFDKRLDFLIYEGSDIDGRPILIKTTKNATPVQIEKLLQEEKILQRLKSERVIQPLKMIEDKGQVFLILEKFGIPLSEYINKGPLDLESFLNMASALAEGLGEIHHKHIIHKDINPHNILIDPTTKAIKFQNFDVATTLSRDKPYLLKFNMGEGTFSYISPEQTGRLNRALDYRTDIYSLGVVFYELLTRKRPFESDNPLELIHMHIAKKAISPKEIDPKIPPLFSDMVMKCLSKNNVSSTLVSSPLGFELLRKLEKKGLYKVNV